MREARIIAIFVAALVLVAAPLSAQQRAQPTGAHVVACSGTFAKDSSHLKLAMFFDSKNITFTDVAASDGSKVPASVLFPNDPKRRLEVWWSNPTARKDIHLIVIGGQGYSSDRHRRPVDLGRAGRLAAGPDFGASGKAQSQAVQAQRFR